MATSSGPSHPAGWATMGTRLMTSTLTSPMRLPRAMPRYSRSPAMYLTWREIATNSSPARAAEAPDVARKKSCHGSARYASIAGVNCRSETGGCTDSPGVTSRTVWLAGNVVDAVAVPDVDLVIRPPTPAVAGEAAVAVACTGLLLVLAELPEADLAHHWTTVWAVRSDAVLSLLSPRAAGSTIEWTSATWNPGAAPRPTGSSRTPARRSHRATGGWWKALWNWRLGVEWSSRRHRYARRMSKLGD